MGRTLYIVPTAGHELLNGKIVPCKAGRRRLKTLAVCLRTDGNGRGAITGGRLTTPTRAEVMRRWFVGEYPDLESRLLVVVAPSYCTAPDMGGLIKKLKPSDEIDEMVIISHPNHAGLAASSLRAYLNNGPLRIYPVNSGEAAPYSPRILKILRLVGRLDPRWIWLAWPLRFVAMYRESHDQPKPYTG